MKLGSNYSIYFAWRRDPDGVISTIAKRRHEEVGVEMGKSYRQLELLGWKFTITPMRFFLTGLALLCLGVVVVRLVTGYHLVTNLSDESPWGLWIAFDVMTGVALAGGGYSTALLVHSFSYEKYKVVARGALLTSLFGYILVMVGLFLDIGQWFNFWRPFVSWGYHSVLFEVFWCVSIYTTVLALEFCEVLTERIVKNMHRYIVRALPILIIVGLIFPMMHQSSLGGLFLIAKSKMYPLWWSEFLPLYFLLSSFFVGSAMVCVETELARRAYSHEIEVRVLKRLSRVGGRVMVAYLLLKLYDLAAKNQWDLLVANTLQSNLYLLEMVIGIIIPICLIFSPLVNTRRGLLAYAGLTVFGVVFNRMNCVFTSMYSGNYFPTVWEFIVSIGLVSIGCLVYCFIVENFRVIGDEYAVQARFQKTQKAKYQVWTADSQQIFQHKD